MIRFDDVHTIRCVASAARIQFVPHKHHAIGQYSSDDQLMGGTLFTDYWGGSVMMHVAIFGKPVGMRPMLWLSFQYPFVQLGVKKVFGLVPEWNVKARNFDLHLGFQIEYLIADVFNDDDLNGMYLMSMRKQDCKWLDMKMPYIDYAPLDRCNPIDMPLATMSTVGAMQ